MSTLEFLKSNYAAAESTVRAFDVKSQITLVAVALSLTPLLSMISMFGGAENSQVLIIFPFITWVTSIVLLLFVLAPISGRNLISRNSESLFFFDPEHNFKEDEYVKKLESCDINSEFIHEIAIMHTIRQKKSARFKVAIYGTFCHFVVSACIVVYSW